MQRMRKSISLEKLKNMSPRVPTITEDMSELYYTLQSEDKAAEKHMRLKKKHYDYQQLLTRKLSQPRLPRMKLDFQEQC